jgi:hypothetical protein
MVFIMDGIPEPCLEFGLEPEAGPIKTFFLKWLKNKTGARMAGLIF